MSKVKIIGKADIPFGPLIPMKAYPEVREKLKRIAEKRGLKGRAAVVSYLVTKEIQEIEREEREARRGS